MSKKSLVGRCIRRWKVYFKPACDSKVSAIWRKRDLKGCIREFGQVTADSMILGMADRNAKVDFGIHGWSPEFGLWFNERKDQYYAEAESYLNEEATTEEIDDVIREEISDWSC